MLCSHWTIPEVSLDNWKEPLTVPRCILGIGEGAGNGWGTDDIISPGRNPQTTHQVLGQVSSQPASELPSLCCSPLRDERGMEIPWSPSWIPFLASATLMPHAFPEICCLFSSLQSALLQTTEFDYQRLVFFFLPSFPVPGCMVFFFFCPFLRLKGLIFFIFAFSNKIV